MGGLRSCVACVGLAILAVLVPTTNAVYDDRYQMHWLEKNHNVLRHPKRDAVCQQSGFTLCPESVNGGCCPTNYACAVSSCYAATAGPTSACGKTGYYNCPLTAGAGACCPVGYLCGSSTQDCLPPVGMLYSQSCPSSWFGCASSFGYGCCPDGMLCGTASCYGTSLKTLPVSEKVTTTNSKGDTITTVVTSFSVISPGPDPSDTTSATVAGVPKLIPSTVSKLAALETGGGSDSGDSSGNGLSQAQIGGIVGGAIGLLAIIVIIAAIVLWRLKRTEKAAKAAAKSRRDNSNSDPRSQKSGYGQVSISEVDGTDVDSYMRTRNAHFRARSDSSTVGDQSRAETPNYYGSNASTTPPAWPVHFAQLPGSDASDGRQSSLDSYGVRHDNGFFPQRPSVDSEAPRKHTRQWSDASELDGSVVSAHGVSELGSPDALEAARRRSNSSTRPPKVQVRRSSDPSGSSRGARGEATAPAVAPLGTLAEISELHGYYGSPDLAVGQTAARLNKKDSTISSTPGHDS
ncbi:hypothetical protein F4774DRAFT_418033 [Daldinia eschscholtzii]|nr:hypothetical protein F4774DRAFT_418033 [Daldinia eschscholtzii]